ncbi:DUF3429 domain-containing protein [Maricaulis sp.]|uniref:DUF3429 domain-containing protein n=1 Tax=Maricaulis sp. TaxID=1486257 RepID=UPI002602DF62|nr:DUF3429 domain-containing protein [Maricaulis sp.]
MSTKTLPASALLLGIAGWIPFWIPVALSAHALLTGRSAAAEEWMFTVYAGLILSFLGGVRWGREIMARDVPDLAVLSASVAPSVLGLMGALIHWAGHPYFAWMLLAISLLVMMAWDRQAAARGELPAWFGRLRLILTLGAVGSAIAMILLYLLARS